MSFRSHALRLVRPFLPLLLAAALAACGGGNGEGSGSSGASGTPARGALLSSPAHVASYSVADLVAMLGGNSAGEELLALAFSPTCAIEVYQLEYETVGGQGEPTTASGALIVPVGVSSPCEGGAPLLLYAHGTTADKTFNIAALSSSNDTEGLLLAAVFASRGYIVVAPNYAGYDTSALGYHPYLNADQQSKEMIDVLKAARSALPVATSPAVTDNHKLFLTGYSQGGFVALAAHRAMQAAGMAVTAAAPMSGPYALAAFGDAIFMGEVNASADLNFTLLASSYQHAYGNLYTNVTDVFESQYAAGIATLLPSTEPISSLYSQGKLPQNVLFNSTPPAPEFASITPATSPSALAPIFALGFGTPDLVTNAYRLAYLRDAQAAPDGGFPTVSTGIPAASPGSALRQDLKANDLRNWAPVAPVLLCGGDQDPTAFFLNTQLMQHYWTLNPPTGAVTVLDVDSAVTSGDPYANLKNGFAAAKALLAANAIASGATDGGALAVLQAYHGRLVPPFCLSAVKSFFDGF